AFLHYSWPGNIRELENIVERINVLLQLDHEILTPEFLKQQLPELFQSQNHHTTQPLLKEVKVNQELSLIEQTLAEVEGDLDLAAQKLGISRTTLWRRMKLINH
ncbi:helix-turn-helix domain-containing protein, partial [Acinetobacter baumannii]